MFPSWKNEDLAPTFVLMEVSQVLLVCEDDGLVLSDNLAPEALPTRGQIPQLLQLTHSARQTHTYTHYQATEPALFPRRGSGVPTKQENKWTWKFSQGQGRPWTTATLQVHRASSGHMTHHSRRNGCMTGRLLTITETLSNVWGKLSGGEEL